MKYLIFNHVFPVVFSEGIRHVDITVTLNGHPAKVTGAGHVRDICPEFSYDDNGHKDSYTLVPEVEGESVSLNITSTPEDAEIIGRMLDGEEVS